MLALLIDTDPGLDDALALLYAWHSPEARVVAVTTVAGNVPLEAATLNLARLLALAAPAVPPRVAAGADRPLARPLVTAAYYHGRDGLGDLADWPPAAPAPEPAGAVALLAGLLADPAGPRHLVALGPLTNVARLLDAAPAALARLARLVVMGGAVDVPGNVTPRAEFNFHVDPEAAARVLAAGLPVDLVPLDATRQAVLPRADLERALARRPGPIAARVAAFTAHAFRVDLARGERGMALHDPLAVALALDPALARWEEARLDVGPEGECLRVPGPPNCRVARTIEAPRFLARFLERLCRASSS
jgi:inosine-uridine nucleoside N-ribohydrolase